MNNSEGQTQEPVGGLYEPTHIVSDILKEYSLKAVRSVGTGCNHDEYILAKDFFKIIQELLQIFIPPMSAPIKTEGLESLKEIMIKFGEAHNLLAKTKLTTEEYRPISSLLANAKVELFNFYKEFKGPPSPVGIEALAKQKAKEKYPGEMNMMGYKINAQKNNQEKFIEGFKAGYAATPQHNFIKELLLFIEDDGKPVDGYRFREIALKLKNNSPQSSTEEEKDLWEKSLSFFLDEFMSKPFTTKEEVISELMLNYKISKR